MTKFGNAPVMCGEFPISLPEVMYYLYLPVWMDCDTDFRRIIRLPANVERCRPLVERAIRESPPFKYVYLSARKGWATPDNPLNRPGWHCDGFGSPDLNYVWWKGPGTRFAVQRFRDISDDHQLSLQQFEAQVIGRYVVTPPEQCLYRLDASVVHATPLIRPPGCMRQYIKISLSDRQYNLENNSHNYLFDYDWPLYPRDAIRNDTQKA